MFNYFKLKAFSLIIPPTNHLALTFDLSKPQFRQAQ